jgi:succinoglycan biosynthesis transport protein ExoP
MEEPKPHLALEAGPDRQPPPGRALSRPGYIDLAPESRPEEDLAGTGIRDYVYALLRRKWMVLSLALAGLVVGVAAIVPKPLPYLARVSVEVQGVNENFMKMNEVDPQAASGMYGASGLNIMTQVRILNSSTLRRRALDKLERETIPSLPPQGGGTAAFVNRLRGSLGLNTSEPTRALREALGSASASLSAKAVPDTRVVEITCQSTHPDVGAEFLNTLVNEYIDQSIEVRAKAAQRTSQWLANQLEEQKARLEQAEERLRQFVSQSGVAGLTQEDSRNTLAQSKLQSLQAELSLIQSDRIAKQSRFETASAKGVESMQELITPQLRGQLDSIADLQRRRAELLESLTPAHYRVKRLQAQIDEMESAARKERAKVLQGLKNEYETALRRERLLSAAYGGQSGTLLAQADKATKYSLLRRDVDTSRQLYNVMVQQVNQAGVAAAVPTSNMRVIDAASPPAEPSFEYVYMGGGLGLVTGLLFGCVLAIVLQQLDRRLRLPGQAFRSLQLPELGVIPSETIGRPLPVRSRVARYARPIFGGAGAVGDTGNGDTHRVELMTFRHKPSAIAESFRATLMSILFSVEGQKNAVWSVTSPNPREGKSTVASNLAIALAELRRRVLIVDADMRKPRQHGIFDVPNTWGLSDVLQENLPIDGYPADSLFRTTEIPNLFVLPSGPAVEVINTLLCSDRLARLIERLRRDFDTVIIDTPPMMMLPDARIIGQSVDAVILVFRAGLTSTDDARSCSVRLIDDGARILGTVLNDWRPSSSGGSYRKYYSHYRAYYSSPEQS